MTRIAISPLLILVLATTTLLGKGPKYDVSSTKYRNGGYSSGASISKFTQSPTKIQASRGPRAATSISRLPTQSSIATKYRSAGKRPRAPVPSTGAVSGKSYQRFSTKRPTYGSSQAIGPSPSAGNRQPTRPVRFPTKSGVNSSARSSDKRKTRPASTQRPPIVFYPKPSKGTTTGNRPPTSARPTVQRPATSRPSSPPTARPYKRKYTQPTLRPVNQTNLNQGNIVQSQTRGPIIINRPTTINQTTNNITRETNNINNWYTNNHWQNRVTINSGHWNGRPWWYKPDYGDWHHGHWHGHYVRGGTYRNDWHHVDSAEHSWLSGLAAWGLGNLIYRTGYQLYANPYQVRPFVVGSTTIDYSRPITVQRSVYEQAYLNDQAKATQLRQQALRYFQVARRAFYMRDLNGAYNNINQAVALMPDDASMHEFRALVLFAEGRYREAAEAVHAVLAVAPGWDWTTLSGLYPDTDVYVGQLRALEVYVRNNPRQGDARFLLAYHYITLGHIASAAAQLRAVASLNPTDGLASDLLDLIADDEGDEEGQASTADGRSLSNQDLQGEWKARRTDGKIELDIEGDRFAWDYDLDDNDTEFRGKFALAQDIMVLASADGSQMVGQVTMKDTDEFVFRLIGVDEDDPGIVFRRA